MYLMMHISIIINISILGKTDLNELHVILLKYKLEN